MTTELATVDSAAAETVTQHFGWWPDDKRAFPNALARSAVFTIGNRSDYRPRYMAAKPLKVHATSDMVIRYHGEELRQDDCDVYLQLINLFRNLPASEVVSFVPVGLLRELGWGLSADYYERLRTCILRLTGAVVSIEVSQKQGTRTRKSGYAGALIHKFKYKEEDGETPMRLWQVHLNPDMVALFGKNEHTWLDWDLRTNLKSPLAKKLHYFYASHKGDSYPLSVDFLWQLSGSSTGFKEFKRNVQKDFDHLVEQGRLEKREANKVMDSGASGLQEFMRFLSESLENWIEHGVINKSEAIKIMAHSKAGIRYFKKTLITAMKELVDKGYLAGYDISRTNILSITKNPDIPRQGSLLDN